MAGRKPKTHLCPCCLNPATRRGYSCYFDCDYCEARLVMKKGVLQETRPYTPKAEAEKVEKPCYRMSADEFERLVG